MTKLRIFAASPSDMTLERAKVETVANEFRPLAEHLGISIEVLDWRKVVPDMGRPEQVILDQLQPTSWDVFIGILWHRFGTPPNAKDPQTQKDYDSGTEEEFNIACRLRQNHGRPRIMMYRCTRAIPPEALDPEQFTRVRDFFAQFAAVKGEHPGLCQTFDTTEAFEKLLRENLQRLLLKYGEELKGSPVDPSVVQVFAPKIPNNLPRRAPFFGREKDMDKVLGALSPDERGWGVVIDGIGGIGKTALAVEAAYLAQQRAMFDAFVFVSAKEKYLKPEGIADEAAAARTLDEFLNETARVLGETGIAKLSGEQKKLALLDVLRGTRALLIYDNLETLTKVEQEALADFLRRLPQNSKAILTSRRRGGEGGLWLRLEKLEWDAARQIIEAEAKKSDGLAKKLQSAEPRWPELHDETKGSPLALVHVLGLMRTRLTLTFDGALELLRGNRDPDLQRFIFKEAQKELGASGIATLRALSYFVPSAPFEALMEVAEQSRNTLEMALDRLDALSLLDKLEAADRFALHPQTRNFVRDELLADAQVAQDTAWRFASYWTAYAERYGGYTSYQTYDRIEAEWPNLEATVEGLWQRAAVQGEAVGDKEAARKLNDLASALSHFLMFAGRWDEWVKLAGRAYDAMLALKDWSNAGWRAYDVAWIHSTYGRDEAEQASHWADRCAEAWAKGGSRLEQAVALRLRGLVARQRKDYDTAEKLLQDALKAYRDLNDEKNMGTVLNDLGVLEWRRHRYDEAERHWHEALALVEQRRYREQQAYLLSNLGRLALDRESWSVAREWYEKALPLAREIGRQDLIASSQFGLAHVNEEEDRPDLALPLAEQALVIYERLRHRDLAEARELVERLKGKQG